MNENLRLYEQLRSCPPEALRTIAAGRLKGKSDINPMWRIKVLTEAFGPCGVGWAIRNVNFWCVPGANDEILAFCSLELVYKENGEWSEPVMGIGGSSLVSLEKSGLYSNDEAYKMAYTDAISVAAKLLGVAADVYWEKDPTKYQANSQPNVGAICPICGKEMVKPVLYKGQKISPSDWIAKVGICDRCYQGAKPNESKA